MNREREWQQVVTAGVIIVGGGQAGARAAHSLREAGFSDPIRVYCEEPHLPYERPELSKGLLKDPHHPIPYAFDATAYPAMGIELVLGVRVELIDRIAKEVALSNGERAGYDYLLLATGSRLRAFSIDGYPDERIHALRTLDDCAGLRDKLAEKPAISIVGGGFIGLEVAATATSLGCSVTVVEMADRLLPRLGCAEASEAVRAHHERNGIEFHLGTRIVKGAGRSLQLEDTTQIAADYVIAGIGIIPNTELAEAAGIEVDNGIITDEAGRTSDPAIFAIGDVARFRHPRLERHVRFESWQAANQQATAAGFAIAGRMVDNVDIPWVWSDQGDLNLQIAGAPAVIDQIIVRKNDEDGMTVLQLYESKIVGGLTINNGKDMAALRRLLESTPSTLSTDLLMDTSVPLRKFIAR